MGLTAGRHGVVVIHGISENGERGELLASVANSLADSLLESPAGQGTDSPVYPVIERAMDVTKEPPSATLHIKAPDNAETTWVFREAFWADAFPPPQASSVLRWLWRQIGGQLAYVWKSLRRDPANNEDYRPEGRQAQEKPWWRAHARITWVYRAELALAGILLLPLSVVVPLLLFIIWPLYWMPRFDFLAQFLGWLHKLDPFLSQSLGDVKRYIEHGMWSASARERLEIVVIDMLNGVYGDVDDITIVAHSMGAVVTYDALTEGGNIAQVKGQLEANGRRKKLTFVSVGSGINQVFRMAKNSNLYAKMRFSRPLAKEITGFDPDGNQDATSLQDIFFWLDIYARFDPVPAGDLDDEIIKQAQVHSEQVKRRRVINLDNPVRDHSYYWKNKDLVIPRIARAINGGKEYPWPEAGIVIEAAAGAAGTPEARAATNKAKRHIEGVARLVMLRLLMIVIVVGCLVAAGLVWLGPLTILPYQVWLFFALLAYGGYQAIRSSMFGEIS